VVALLAAGAEMNKQDKYRGSPVTYAAENGHDAVVAALVAAGAEAGAYTRAHLSST
jgi:ankyrin repeat protein